MNRHERLRQLMKVRGVDAVVIRRPANFAWYTGGADTKVDHVPSEGVADLVAWADAELVLTNTVEAPRMRAEQVSAEAGLPGEWRLHHQGGLTGYASRELIATPSTHALIEPGQAFAWNPSVTGANAEETLVLTDQGPEVVAGAALAVA